MTDPLRLGIWISQMRDTPHPGRGWCGYWDESCVGIIEGLEGEIVAHRDPKAPRVKRLPSRAVETTPEIEIVETDIDAAMKSTPQVQQRQTRTIFQPCQRDKGKFAALGSHYTA